MPPSLPSTGRDLPSVGNAHPPAGALLERAYQRLLAAAGISIDGARPWDMQVHDRRLWRRLALHGTRGFGEAYVEGWWDVERLDAFFERVIGAQVDRRLWNLPKRALDLLAIVGNLQGVRRAREVGLRHYDLDSEFYRAMLGPRRIYTCGYWRDATTLDAAQEHKLDLVCRKLELTPGMRLLDIGCGWGGLARYAAERYGVEVVGVTISAEQAAVARAECRGLPIDIRTQDYREIGGRFDRIVSLGMFEHVGRKNYRRFMTLARQLLMPDGLCLIHTIGLTHDSSGIDPWVTQYIFPNSEIPSMPRLIAAIGDVFRLEDWHAFGPDYDRTLMAWHDNFSAAWPRFSARFARGFQRMWRYYLLMFAGAFRARSLDLWQVVLAPPSRGARYQRPDR